LTPADGNDRLFRKVGKNYHYPPRNVPKSSVLNFHEVLPVGTDLFHAEERTGRQTDRHGEKSLFAPLRPSLKGLMMEC
jgi:hypothetical protein